ncbi:sulfatase [Streptomyces sp. CWNU-52B]|uniref:sulfatase n=1 Tax=unclassified Streptomyces TaxID=2593676 RepID=UPI0039C27063
MSSTTNSDQLPDIDRATPKKPESPEPLPPAESAAAGIPGTRAEAADASAGEAGAATPAETEDEPAPAEGPEDSAAGTGTEDVETEETTETTETEVVAGASADVADGEDIEGTGDPAVPEKTADPDRTATPATTPDKPLDKGPATSDAAADGGEPVPVDEGTPTTAQAAAGQAAGPAEASPAEEGATAEAPQAPRGWRAKYPAAARSVTFTVTGLAAVLVLFALLMPNEIDRFRPGTFIRLPVEAIFGAAVLMVLPRTPRLVAAILAGLGLGALTVLNLLDLGFNEFLGRGFNVVLDWVLFDDARTYLEDSMGKAGAVGVVIAVVALVVGVFALMILSVVRLANLLGRHSGRATRATLVAGTVWVACSALGVQFAGVQFAARSTAGAVQNRVDRVQATLKDEAEFAKEAKKDTFAKTPGDQLLTDLRGKDVIFGFIESYGRSAIEDPVMAPGVDATLDDKTAELTKAGYAAKSGWLTSATYGGSSWLGHSTFLSGLWISNQARYRTVTAGEHLTLTGAFRRTGAWRTVGIMPGVQKNWPEASFYGLDNVYDSRELGYEGPKFSWSTMPDQYALSAYQRLEHGKKRDKPLMSEIILTSSHQPWAPIPKTIPWDEVGDGSVYEDIQKDGKKASDVFYDSTKVKEEYGKSIQYSVTSLIDYVVKYGDKNTVLVFLGDHQPLARVSGNHASRDVPISIVAHDKSVLDKIDDWGWTEGLKPDDTAPVWRMDSFRDRFLTAYGSTPRP